MVDKIFEFFGYLYKNLGGKQDFDKTVIAFIEKRRRKEMVFYWLSFVFIISLIVLILYFAVKTFISNAVYSGVFDYFSILLSDFDLFFSIWYEFLSAIIFSLPFYELFLIVGGVLFLFLFVWWFGGRYKPSLLINE